ncbi:hypothetical protein Bca52824_026802 [Brassica carinata]|uniref:Uncharacterized protein n=1 Tax=Brassica carinata TaxID=52824 RepID=A0A8X7SHB7_BRACI|nr:hypothetical protein Bca52824_026802 [Brassica carinata]
MAKKRADKAAVFHEGHTSKTTEYLFGPLHYHFDQRPCSLPLVQRAEKDCEEAEASAQFMKKVTDILTRGAVADCTAEDFGDIFAPQPQPLHDPLVPSPPRTRKELASFQECELRLRNRFGKGRKEETAKGRLRAVEKGKNCPFGSKELVTKRTKSQKGKDAAGASGQVEQDGAVQTAVLPAGTIPTTVLPSQVGLGNNEPGLPVDPITEVRVTAEDDQQEQVQEDDAGSSNAGNDSGQNIGANNVRVAGAGVGVEPSMRDILEAMQLMGAQMARSKTKPESLLLHQSVMSLLQSSLALTGVKAPWRLSSSLQCHRINHPRRAQPASSKNQAAAKLLPRAQPSPSCSAARAPPRLQVNSSPP